MTDPLTGDLPEMFPREEWNSMRAFKLVRTAQPHLDGAALTGALEAIRRHFDKHGTVTTWSPHAGGSTAKFLAMKRAEQEFYRACAAEHAGRYRANQSTVDAAVLLVIDAEGNTVPRAALLDAGVPVDEVSRISGKPGSRRKVKKALERHQHHENAQRMIQNEGKREYMRLAADTLSGSLEGIAVNMKTQARLARLEQQVAELELFRAEQLRINAAQAARNSITDTGIDPKAEALSLHTAGHGYKVIAARLGRSQSTVRNWIKAA